MKQRPRIFYTEADKALMWDRWQKGESLHSIARQFDRHHSSIQGVLTRTGSIRPPKRRRSSLALTLEIHFYNRVIVIESQSDLVVANQ